MVVRRARQAGRSKPQPIRHLKMAADIHRRQRAQGSRALLGSLGLTTITKAMRLLRAVHCCTCIVLMQHVLTPCRVGGRGGIERLLSEQLPYIIASASGCARATVVLVLHGSTEEWIVEQGKSPARLGERGAWPDLGGP